MLPEKLKVCIAFFEILPKHFKNHFNQITKKNKKHVYVFHNIIPSEFRILQSYCAFQVPLQKDPSWLWETIERWLKTCVTKLSGEVPECVRPMINTDLHEEMKWLKKTIEALNSPVVFCHNDMQEGNILLNQDDFDNNNVESRLVVIGKDYHQY